MSFELISIIVSALGTALAASFLTLFKNYFDKKKRIVEDKEVADDVEKTITKIITARPDEKITDVLSLMIKNVGELREYYVINKQQARNSYSAALFISIH